MTENTKSMLASWLTTGKAPEWKVYIHICQTILYFNQSDIYFENARGVVRYLNRI